MPSEAEAAVETATIVQANVPTDGPEKPPTPPGEAEGSVPAAGAEGSSWNRGRWARG